MAALLQPSLSHFPDTPATLGDTALPFGVVCQPLAPLDAAEQVAAEELARCGGCGAYINAYCTFLRREWRCSLCGHLTALSERYASAAERRELPELVEHAVEATFADGADGADAIAEGAPSRPPVYLAVVDACGGEDFLEVVRAALHAGLAGLAADAYFGLLVVGDT